MQMKRRAAALIAVTFTFVGVNVTTAKADIGGRPTAAATAATATTPAILGRYRFPRLAEWAGHSVEMLLSTYAKCVDGQEDLARKRIERALDWNDDESA